jgi:hypothetical protein
MKIVIGGSMAFAKEQIAIKDILVTAGHTVLLTDDIGEYVEKPAIKSSFEEELRISREYDIMRSFFNKIAESDAFFVCNLPKNGISGYLGTSVLMELGLAYYLEKRIYLLHDFDRSQGCALEVAIIDPVVLNGDATLIPND